MSQQHYQQDFLINQSAGSIDNVNLANFNFQQEESNVTKSTGTRQDGTKNTYERLFKGTFIQRPGERDATRTGGRRNRNEILGLTLIRLIKEKHLNGSQYSRDIELLRGIQMKSNTADFVIVLRTNGRIVAMSDEVEQHMGKSMRSLYTQCINIFQCLDETDGNKLRTVLNTSADLVHREHRLVCTFRLPKGKRPSRTREDIKTITMAGHFYSCHDSSSSSHEKLFIARCQALVSRTTNGSSSSQTTMMTNNNDNTNSMLQIRLNENMSINFASSNVKEILGYSRNEMMGNWLGRYLATNDLEKFEAIRQKYFQHEQQQVPTSVCDIFDMYANNGDGRLTFLFQIRPIRERRSKSIKFQIVAQLIDPSLRSEYIKYVESESEINPRPIKAEQVNHVPSSVSKTREDTIMANSSLLDKGLLKFHNTSNDFIPYQQPSPFHRSLSNVVAPVNVHDESWRQLFDLEYNQYSATTDFQYGSSKFFDDATFIECQSEQGLANIFDDYLYEYLMGDDSC